MSKKRNNYINKTIKEEISNMDMQTNNVSKEYINYHKHSDFSNTRTIDSITKMKHYCERAKELGHTVISTVEHGYQGDVHAINTLAKEYGLKMVVGAEAYFWFKNGSRSRSLLRTR